MSRVGKYILRAWAALALPAAFASCLSAHDSAVADIDPAGWEFSAKIVYNNADTAAIREAALFLRYGGGARGGAYVIELRAPSGAKARDTIAVDIASGILSNSLHEIHIPYRRGIRLAEEGNYVFIITPPEGTRGIWSAGIDFRNSNIHNGQE